jgi:hypothetical protein
MCCGYNTTAYAPQLWGGDQNISREKAYSEAMVSQVTFGSADG